MAWAAVATSASMGFLRPSSLDVAFAVPRFLLANGRRRSRQRNKTTTPMKRLLCVTIAFVCATALQAQEAEKNVTKFLGIPIDGTKAEMVEKLKAKGFRSTSSNSDSDMLEGEFNGVDVYVGVVTNNNKVYRIMVADQNPRGESDIKNRFNRLCRQFENNPKYTPITDKDQTIPENEDISYEIAVHDKQYQAAYYQHPKLDSIAIYNEAKRSLFPKYTQEQLDNPSEDILFEIKMQYYENYGSYLFEQLFMKNKIVWFSIAESYGKYYICIYYDNRYNEANGEDL